MRDLGAAYDTAIETTGSQPRYKVQMRGWGGAPDPLDISSRVAGWSVSRQLRNVADGVTLVVENSDGIFDPGGAWEGALDPNNGQVEIDAGERIGGTESLWRVFTGGVLSSRQTEQVTGAPLKVTLGNRGRNLAAIRMTSRRYGDPDDEVPVPWEALDIIKDLFADHAGFVDPDDFDLPALVFPTIGVQFEGEGLVSAANSCLQPSGRSLYFAYDGRLSHRALIPADWVPELTLVAGMAAQIGPEKKPPDATRIMVTGGPRTTDRPTIGEAEVWASGGYHFESVNPLVLAKARGITPTRWGVETAGYPDGWYTATGWVAWLNLAGPEDKQYRLGYSFVPHKGWSVSGAGPSSDMTASPDTKLEIRVDCSAVTEVTFNWAGCNTGDLIAAEVQGKIRALGGHFSAVTVEYLLDDGATWHYFVRGPLGRKQEKALIITDAGANNCADDLKLGVANGGTETVQPEVRWANDPRLLTGGELVLLEVNWRNLPPLTNSEEWSTVTNRQEIEIYLQVLNNTPPARYLDFDFDVMGYPLADVTLSVDTQAWDDALITSYGEIKKMVSAPLAQTYEHSDAVAQLELIFAQKSVAPVSVRLPRADLRIEPGDVVRMPYRTGTIDVWVHSVAIAFDNSPKHTQSLQGFVL